jgi:Tol biopolymer transport system component
MARRAHRWVRLAAVLTVAIVLTSAAPAVASSNDSEAPPNAPPHWLPPEAWVYNHWLPYDEGRLYRLVHISRRQLWSQLRDDHHTVAELAARHGWPQPRRLAAALVAPRARQVGLRRLRLLAARALRTLTQGHLAQHLFFHSLHQFAIPSEAPDIFGVTDAEFRALRRSELSPLDIGRLHGRSPSTVQVNCAAVLRERVRAGVRGRAMTARQGRILLRRQLSQLPRWLGQERYNGPPQTHGGRLIAKPRDYASNPAISADGAHVAFEVYLQKLPVALQRGEINITAHDVANGTDVLASPPSSACSPPSSSYNPSVSGDGRYIAFECAEGNRNFAKRYGQIQVLVRDTVASTTQVIAAPRGGNRHLSRSYYNPAISADGRRLAFEAVQGDGHTAVLVRDLQTGATAIASNGLSGDFYEPSISADGRFVAFTAARSSSALARVLVRDVVAGTTALVSRATGPSGAVADDFASNPSISADGRFVAFTSAARNLTAARTAGMRTRIYVRDLLAERTVAVSRAADGLTLDPAISADGQSVAYTSVAAGGSQVLVCDLTHGMTRIASRATGADGAQADGRANDPSISADGTRVAFASAATNLSPGKPDDTRGVFIRDLPAQTTSLISAPSGNP